MCFSMFPLDICYYYLCYAFLRNHSTLYSSCPGIQKVMTWLGVKTGVETLKTGFCFKTDISVVFHPVS